MERFSIVPIPDQPQTSFNYLKIGVPDGRLCLTFYNHKFYLNQPLSSYPVEIWVMKDYGVKESWTKFLIVGEKSTLMPLCISKGNEVISINEKKDLIRSGAEEAISEKYRICKCDAEAFGDNHRRHQHQCHAIAKEAIPLDPGF
ncbi:F-box associated domain [Theobroma cacao]|nr:F-box associated domain [Theobroma cacao]